MADGEICQHTTTTKDGRKLVCGQVHDPRKCKGHKNLYEVDGDRTTPLVGIRPCQLRPCKGQKVCHMHGGKSPNAKAGAEVRKAEEKARELFGKMAGEPTPITNPLAMYAELAGRVVEWMRTMDTLLDDLQSPRFTDDRGAEQIRGEVQLFERSMDRANAVLASYARLNIDQRLAAIEEEKVNLVAAALGKTLAEMGLSAEQQREARNGLVRHLRVVPGRPTGGTRPAVGA